MAENIPFPVLPIPQQHKDLVRSVNAYVHGYMSSPDHDSSHDYHHILRVVSNANRLLALEKEQNPSQEYNVPALFLAALLHDVGDHKYAAPGEDVKNLVSTILQARGADADLATRVQTVVKHVGYSNESKDPQSVINVLKKYPELAIVQDADRLDAIGAVGIARCFSFSAAKLKEQPMSVAIEHFHEKLFLLAGMMKTGAGKELAERRKRVLEEFAAEFGEESKLSFVVE
ncbi:unnamed protein product [Periconia digitata]|uniref:HD/PDEase domain-containing protein n=1 Tax=Periconia digitata TaxID=1303443 RepID=A0A9W4U7J8_9PLEO|nr:unnamed protein product [Periconia digitata]